jgi:RNA polymerase sigma-70 factor (ECF subfamily)
MFSVDPFQGGGKRIRPNIWSPFSAKTIIDLSEEWFYFPRGEIVTDPPVSNEGGSQTSTGLLQRAMLREQAAWDKVVHLYGPLVYRWCRRWGLQPKDAENVGQEVFLRVFQGLPNFRQQAGGGFRAWLHRISRNCYVDHVRGQHQSPAAGRGGSDGLAHMQEIPAEPLEEEDSDATRRQDEALLYQQAVRLIREEFSERDWNIFMQLVTENRAATEVAEAFGVTSNIVYLTKSRILKRLREEFAELLDI